MDNLFEASYIKYQLSKNHPKTYYPSIIRPLKKERVYAGNPFKTATQAKKFAQQIIDRMCRIYGGLK